LTIDLHVAQEAASLRATNNFKTPDALVIATGIVGQVGHLVTNDSEWNKKLLSMKARVQVTELTNYVCREFSAVARIRVFFPAHRKRGIEWWRRRPQQLQRRGADAE